MRKSGTVIHLILSVSFTLLLSPCDAIRAENQLLDTLEKEMTKLVERVQPSVVSVSAKCKTRHCGQMLSSSTVHTPKAPQEEEFSWQTNVGSGFILDSRGHILTTENVIRSAEKFEVTLSNGEQYIAQLIGTDSESNIAVLKIEGDHFTPAKVGDPNRLKVGSWITILGNSFGLSSAVSFGLVNGIRQEDDLIQMSAYVNPGNSGAAALNTKGEVIGLVTAAVTEPVTVTIGAPGDQRQPQQRFDFRSHGASLAIPAHRATAIARELIEHGKYERSWLGVTIQNMTNEQAMKLNVASGVFVTFVSEPSPASEAGIQQGDVIVEYNGKKVIDGKKLVEWVTSTHIGEAIPITISRNGHQHTLVTKIGDRPSQVAEQTDGQNMNFQEYNVTPETAAMVQPVTSRETLEKRIEQLEEEIRRLEKLFNKEE